MKLYARSFGRTHAVRLLIRRGIDVPQTIKVTTADGVSREINAADWELQDEADTDDSDAVEFRQPDVMEALRGKGFHLSEASNKVTEVR